MVININKEQMLIEIWLASKESEDSDSLNALSPYYGAWKKRGLFPVVFRSGNGSLEDSIDGLLHHNWDAAAKKACELQAEQERIS